MTVEEIKVARIEAENEIVDILNHLEVISECKVKSVRLPLPHTI